MDEKQIIEYFKEKQTPINVIEDLYQMVYDFHNICQLVKFKYITTGGGLLGAIKYGSIISYDDDFDVAYISNEENKDKVLHLMKKLGYKVYFQVGYQGYQIVSHRINNVYPFIDVIPLFLRNDGYYYYSRLTNHNPKFDKQFFWTEYQLFPRHLVPYGNFKVLAPNRDLEYLNTTFPKWQTISKFMGHHRYHDAYSLVLTYIFEDHPEIESKKLPIDVQRIPIKKLKLKYDTFKKLKISPKILEKRKWFYIFKSSQWRWFRFSNEQTDYGIIDQ